MRTLIGLVLAFFLMGGAHAADITVNVSGSTELSPLMFGHNSAWWHGGLDLAKSPMPTTGSIIKTQAEPILKDALKTGLVRFPGCTIDSYHFRRGIGPLDMRLVGTEMVNGQWPMVRWMEDIRL